MARKLIRRDAEEIEHPGLGYAVQNWAIPVARCVSYFEDDNSLVRMVSVKQSGTNSHTGKRWYRWDRKNSTMVSIAHRNGRWVFKHRSGQSWCPFDFYVLRSDARFREMVEAKWPGFSFESVYPLAGHYRVTIRDTDDLFHRQNSYAPDQMPTGILSAFQEPDLKALVVRLFGKTRYRRDLARAVARSHPHAIALAREFRGLVPVDWLAHFLRTNSVETVPQVNPPTNYGNVRRTAKTLSQRELRSLLLADDSLDTNSWYMVRDMCRGPVVRPMGNQAVASWRDLHDKFLNVGALRFQYDYAMDVPQRIVTPKAPEPKAVPWDSLHRALDGLTTESFRIVIPTEGSQLVEWGEEMHNCIGGYVYTLHKHLVLGGVYEGDKLVGNFEISNGRLAQLLGKRNQKSKRLCEELEPLFREKGVTVPDSYWGRAIEPEAHLNELGPLEQAFVDQFGDVPVIPDELLNWR